jgi:hypothetical protein
MKTALVQRVSHIYLLGAFDRSGSFFSRNVS